MEEKTAKTQAVTAANGHRLPLLSENEQMVLAATESLLKKNPSLRDWPKLAEIEAEIIRLGHRPPVLPTIGLIKDRLEAKGYVERDFKVRSYEQGRVVA